MKVTQDKARQAECTVETIAWLHACWERLQRGEPLAPDPFYARNELLTEAVIADVLTGIDKLMAEEFRKYPGYHTTAQGVSASTPLVPPHFLTLPPQERFAIVQGIDRIFQGYKADDPPIGPAPVDYWNYG